MVLGFLFVCFLVFCFFFVFFWEPVDFIFSLSVLGIRERFIIQFIFSPNQDLKWVWVWIDFFLEAIQEAGFPGGSEGKGSACNVGDLGSILGLGRSSGGGHGNPLQYSCLENPHGQRSLAGYSPWGCKESDMTEWLSTFIQEALWRGSSQVH